MEIDRGLLTIIDANINRSKEGLRVTEDIARFIMCDPKITKHNKTIRHGISKALSLLGSDTFRLLDSRDSETDTGRRIKQKSEMNRKNIIDISLSNFKRVQESLRVLEEISKLINTKASALFKELRYETYILEKNFILKAGKKI